MTAHGARLTGLAADLRLAAQRYDDAEHASHTGFGEAQ